MPGALDPHAPQGCRARAEQGLLNENLTNFSATDLDAGEEGPPTAALPIVLNLRSGEW
jgi:hypothetical protein